MAGRPVGLTVFSAARLPCLPSISGSSCHPRPLREAEVPVAGLCRSVLLPLMPPSGHGSSNPGSSASQVRPVLPHPENRPPSFFPPVPPAAHYSSSAPQHQRGLQAPGRWYRCMEPSSCLLPSARRSAAVPLHELSTLTLHHPIIHSFRGPRVSRSLQATGQAWFTGLRMKQ